MLSMNVNFASEHLQRKCAKNVAYAHGRTLPGAPFVATRTIDEVGSGVEEERFNVRRATQ